MSATKPTLLRRTSTLSHLGRALDGQEAEDVERARPMLEALERAADEGKLDGSRALVISGDRVHSPPALRRKTRKRSLDRAVSALERAPVTRSPSLQRSVKRSADALSHAPLADDALRARIERVKRAQLGCSLKVAIAEALESDDFEPLQEFPDSAWSRDAMARLFGQARAKHGPQSERRRLKHWLKRWLRAEQADDCLRRDTPAVYALKYVLKYAHPSPEKACHDEDPLGFVERALRWPTLLDHSTRKLLRYTNRHLPQRTGSDEHVLLKFLMLRHIIPTTGADLATAKLLMDSISAPPVGLQPLHNNVIEILTPTSK